MPPRVTYLTGTWDPTREAISKEIETLRRARQPAGCVVAFSPANRTKWRPGGVITLSNRRWLLLRAVVGAVERLADVTHIFGAMDAWHLLRAAGRRPIVFTVVAEGPALAPALYSRVSLFVAESDRIAADLVRAGIEAARVRTVYPGVDLQAFAPVPMPVQRPFRLLFASSPSDAAELDARGVPLLIALARRLPDIEVRLLWRPWGNRLQVNRALAALDPPDNVIVDRRDVRDMPRAYAGAHAVVACFAAGAGKSCPNSIAEGLACGRPALVSRECGIAGLIERSSAGVSVARTVEGLVYGIRQLESRLGEFTRAARACAEQRFDIRAFRRTYTEIYEALR